MARDLLSMIKCILKIPMDIRNKIKIKIMRERFAKNSIFHPSTIFFDTASIINNLSDKTKILIGSETYIRGNLQVFRHGGKIEIGKNCYIGENTHIWSGANIKIGDRVLISHNCNLFDNDTHPIEAAARHKHFIDIVTKGHPKNINLNDGLLVLENDVWVGCNVIIPGGGGNDWRGSNYCSRECSRT